jgi:MFS family permease
MATVPNESTQPANAATDAGAPAGPSANEMRLFLAGFLTLIAAGMAQATRSDILNLWGQDFGFTQGELGKITGMGLMGFGLSIIFFSFFADLLGYGALMVFAFLLHFAAMVTTLAAPFAFKSAAGREGAYLCLYIGQFLFSLANGTCEAVINPLTATLFPRNKTHWLNILHAGWPGGLVLGAVLGLIFNQIPGVGWPLRWGIVLTPILMYGVLMVGRRFPRSETRTQGVSARQMMGQLGMVGTFLAALLLGLWLSKDVFPDLLGLPGWLGWLAALAIWLTFGWSTGFQLGHWVLAFLFLLHALIGWVELGTDSWIVDIGKFVLNPDLSLMAFIWTNVLMFALRFFAGPIVHKISPVGLLFTSAVIGTAGLLLLGMSAVNTALLWFAAVTVYGIGKTFYWPTMLGVISERFPRGGAIALGFCGGVGMLSAGILGGPIIGYKQDYAAVKALKALPGGDETYERYRATDPQSPLPLLPEIAGLDNGKIGVLKDYMAIREKSEQAGKDGKTLEAAEKQLQLEKDIVLLQKEKSEVPAELTKRLKWWQTEGRPHAPQDYPRIKAVQLIGGKTALTWTAAIPAAMAVGFLLLIVYFRAVGGYKAQVLVGHAAEDEKFTGGTEGPGEG